LAIFFDSNHSIYNDNLVNEKTCFSAPLLFI
jgi:hypothetical protein